ncbi:NAD-dependent epimerase [Methylonatrum kenyense]|uniref:NAD-dependent epimerase n=1 Tax=Methylonatrum kenyense TaxID=455253 RepID=UPI0020BFD702|nr:NAD-dependent epimerase [Methylonatrum kenyense]MCK8516223.1 NAD-dependent epimerase [Methylonatrum kenyense]
MRVLVTGAAGFIGADVCHRLLDRGDQVVGLDNLNNYYDVALKEARLARLQARDGFSFQRLDLADRDDMAALFAGAGFDRVVHLGAQAGVGYSVSHPHAYVDSNLVGFMNVLDGCQRAGVAHLVFASSSSVYGGNRQFPFSEHHAVDHPLSMYAATKKANELMAHSYAHLHGLPVTGLRFFTVYGPWGRPDMALFKFVDRILHGRPIPVHNDGRHQRDFTYIDDITEGVMRSLDRVASANPDWQAVAPDPASSNVPYRIYNIGNGQPVNLMRYIEVIEDCLGRKADKQLLPQQPGDVPDTAADTTDLAHDVGYRPDTPIEVGVQRFVDWYRGYYGV